MLSDNERKEAFSIAYIQAVASVAGFPVYDKRYPDKNSVDLEIQGHTTNGLRTSIVPIYVQAKCTSGAQFRGGSLPYRLEFKNYNEMREGEGIFGPHILVVVLVPPDIDSWLHQSDEALIMKHCGYWMSLKGMPPSQNKSKVTVHIPKGNQFSVEALRQIVNQFKRTGSL